MTRPPFEVADIVRTAGSRFRQRYWRALTWPQIKVLLAIARCRTAALGGHRDQCPRCGYRASLLIVVGIATVPSVKVGRATVGLLPGRANCYRSLISTSSSRCRIISRIWRWSTRRSSTTCCSTPLPRPCSRSRPTPNISAHRSVSWLCCTVAQLGSELVVPSSSPLSDSGRRSFPRPHPLDPSPLSLLPAGGRVLRRVFRGKFVDALQRRFQQHQLIFPGSLRPLQNER